MSRKKANLGVGLRSIHFDYLENNKPKNINWFEAITENFLDTHSNSISRLQKIREYYPIALHGVSLSVASAEDFNQDYLIKVRDLIKKVDPFIVSDHLCWTNNSGNHFHNLFPFSYTKESLEYIVSRIQYLQDFFARPLVFENLSAYISYKDNEYTECQFFNELFKKTQCQILLDVNNVYVNSQNQGFDPKEFIDAIAPENIAEIHLAGYSNMGTHLLDTHANPVFPEVWELLKYTLASKDIPDVPILVEWDNNIPEFEVLAQEAQKADSVWQEVFHV